MWILWVFSAAWGGDGCRSAAREAASAWSTLAVLVPTGSVTVPSVADALAVPVPAGFVTVPSVADALDAVTGHTDVAAALREARSRKGRGRVSEAVLRGTAWLDANPAARGVDRARTALEAARAACTVMVAPAPES